MKENARKGRFCSKAAFTLIELLVVVLIIGILAAVAMPQYQKAVKKSRIMNALPTLSAIARAKEMYYLANEKYTNNLDELDIDLPYTSSSGTVSKVYEGTPLGGLIVLSSTGPMVQWKSSYGFTLEAYGLSAYCFGDESVCSSLGTYYYTTESGKKVYQLYKN